MATERDAAERDELREEYDFARLTGRVRGKYASRFAAGATLVLLDPDVAAAFPTAEAVNAALRKLMQSRKR